MAATTYTIRRKVFTLFGAKFHIYNSEHALIGFCKQKAFKLREDIRVFTDESMTTERLAITARQVIDFSSAYDVFDSKKNEKLGTLQRKGLKSILRDSWIMLDDQEHEIGKVEEDSMAKAVFRRIVSEVIPPSLLLPQSFHLRDADGYELASFHTHFNPFVHKMTVTVEPDGNISPLLVLAAGILLVAIEGRQA